MACDMCTVFKFVLNITEIQYQYGNRGGPIRGTLFLLTELSLYPRHHHCDGVDGEY